MAITPRSRYIITASRLGIGRRATWRKLRSEVTIARTGGDGNKAFEACVQIGSLLPGWRAATAAKKRSSFSRACMFGRNPRHALVHALERFVRETKKRSGAFARYK